MNGGTGFSDQQTVGHYFTNPAGDWIFVRCATANIPASAAGYAVGCILVDTTTGAIYKNVGTNTSCTFVSVDIGGSSFNGVYARTISTTPVATILGASPVGFAGTIDALELINGDTTKGTLVFAKNGVNFATLIKNGTAGGVTGSPVQNVTFVAGDSLTVQSASTDITEVIVYFH